MALLIERVAFLVLLLGQCKGYCVSNSTLLFSGFRSTSESRNVTLLKTVTRARDLNCASECLETPRCHFFNFDENSRACDLLSSVNTAGNDGDSVILLNGEIHYQVDADINLASYFHSGMLQCPANQMCVENAFCRGQCEGRRVCRCKEVGVHGDSCTETYTNYGSPVEMQRFDSHRGFVHTHIGIDDETHFLIIGDSLYCDRLNGDGNCVWENSSPTVYKFDIDAGKYVYHQTLNSSYVPRMVAFVVDNEYYLVTAVHYNYDFDGWHQRDQFNSFLYRYDPKTDMFVLHENQISESCMMYAVDVTTTSSGDVYLALSSVWNETGHRLYHYNSEIGTGGWGTASFLYKWDKELKLFKDRNIIQTKRTYSNAIFEAVDGSLYHAFGQHTHRPPLYNPTVETYDWVEIWKYGPGHKTGMITQSESNTPNTRCSLPFVKDGETYESCTAESNNQYTWCSVDPEYNGNWGKCVDNTIEFSTDQPEWTFEYLHVNLSDVTFVTFEVNVCEDAHIALSPWWGEMDDIYNIAIGGWQNTKSVIRTSRETDDKVYHTESNIVDCTTPRPFWINWADYKFEVGKGHWYGQNVIMTWTDPDPKPIHYIGLYKKGSGKYTFHVPGRPPVGFPPLNRVSLDGATDFTWIGKDYTFEKDGEVIGWEFYAGNVASLRLQVYRPVSDCSFVLIGEYSISSFSVGYNKIYMPDSDRFAVKKGDVVGIVWPGSSVIRYDSTSLTDCCMKGGVNPSSIGTTYTFSGYGKRAYSVRALWWPTGDEWRFHQKLPESDKINVGVVQTNYEDSTYLAVTVHHDGTKPRVYKYNTVRGEFDLWQTIQSEYYNHYYPTFFTTTTDLFLAIPQTENAGAYMVDSPVYRFNGTAFEFHAQLPGGSRAISVSSFQQRNDVFLVLSNFNKENYQNEMDRYNGSAILFKWN